jgi:hypothetical protein
MIFCELTLAIYKPPPQEKYMWSRSVTPQVLLRVFTQAYTIEPIIIVV